MAEVKRSTPPKPAILTGSVKVAGIVLPPLPLEPTEPVFDINQHGTLITGEPGAGKTTLGTQEEGVLNLSFDPLNKTYRIRQEYVPSWDYLKARLAHLKLLDEQHQLPYKRVQIDGMGIASVMCQKYICQQLVITHPSEVGFARAYDRMFEEWGGMVDGFMALSSGAWFIAHEKEKEIETRDGRKFDRISPAIKGQMEGILVGKCQLVISLSFLPGGSMARMATIRGDEAVTAKCNINERFLTPDGRQVREIVLGDQGPAVAWQKFLRAYANGQPWATYDEMKQLVAAQKATAAPKGGKPPEGTEG